MLMLLFHQSDILEANKLWNVIKMNGLRELEIICLEKCSNLLYIIHSEIMKLTYIL
jgi:hypothetical protein